MSSIWWQRQGDIQWGLFNQNVCLCNLWSYIVESSLHRGVRLICFEIARTQIAVFENRANFGCFKLQNLHTHWSQGGFHPYLHVFLIWKCVVISLSKLFFPSLKCVFFSGAGTCYFSADYQVRKRRRKVLKLYKLTQIILFWPRENMWRRPH